MKDSELVKEFEDNKELIVKSVRLNPRELKRFINKVILAKSVLGKPIDGLIVVQALNFRRDWNTFLELLTPDEPRKSFFRWYQKLKEEGTTINTKEDLDKLTQETAIGPNVIQDKGILEIYQELLKQGDTALRNFIDAQGSEKQPHVYEILLNIEKMEEYRRALDTAKLKPQVEQVQWQDVPLYNVKLLKLLRERKVQEFNKVRFETGMFDLDFSDAVLTGYNLTGINLTGVNLSDTNLLYITLSYANLSNANLSYANLSYANLSYANLRGAKLLQANLGNANLAGAFLTGANLRGAFLTGANLRGAFLNRVNLSNTDLSNTDLSSSIIIGCQEYDNALISENTNFDNAIVDRKELLEYLNNKNAR